MAKKRVHLPKDEMPHNNQAIEWWYFNGFLEGKHKYAFMTTLFKVNKKKAKLFRLVPMRNFYFSHSVIFDLTTKRIRKELLPMVITSEDSFKKKELFVDYVYPFRKKFDNYEIIEEDDKLRVKNKFIDLNLKMNKKPLLENKTGFIDLGTKSTYYYSYSNMTAEGYVGKDKVKGTAWHDRQWSSRGYMKDSWLWFSIQIPNNTEIVCADYKGYRFAAICYPDGKQKIFTPKFKSLGNVFYSKTSRLKYNLNWQIQVGDFLIKTKPIMRQCEMNARDLSYWEGPLNVVVNGKKARGFMEYLPEQ